VIYGLVELLGLAMYTVIKCMYSKIQLVFFYCRYIFMSWHEPLKNTCQKTFTKVNCCELV